MSQERIQGVVVVVRGWNIFQELMWGLIWRINCWVEVLKTLFCNYTEMTLTWCILAIKAQYQHHLCFIRGENPRLLQQKPLWGPHWPMLQWFQQRTFNSGYEAFFKAAYRKCLLIAYWLQYFGHMNLKVLQKFRAFRSHKTQL